MERNNQKYSKIVSVSTCDRRSGYIYMYMLGTNVKPQARFKAVRTVLKQSGRL